MTGSTTTLTASQAIFTLGAYTLSNNDWGAQDIGLANGVGYTQSISYNPANIQSGVAMSWSYPNQLASTGAYAYPEIYWGNQLGVGPMTYSTQISNLKSLATNYDVAIGGQTSNFDVGIEIWLSDKPWDQGGKPIDEIMVKVHDTAKGDLQDGEGAATSVGGASAIEAVHPHWGGGAGDWTFVTIDETTDHLSGTIDFASILRELVSEGVVSSSSYVSGVSLGAEPITGGTGTLGVNNFSVSETLATDAVGRVDATDFHGGGVSDVLMSNAAGAVVIGALSGGQESYSQVGALGPEWRFEGSGDLLGDGKADMLVENTSGAVYAGELGSNGQMAYTHIATLGSESSFKGTGDFYATGHAQFLIENTAGAVVVGSVSSAGQTSWTQVGSLGAEWKFVGTGDYLGDGASDFLIQNASGAVAVGEIVNGQAKYSTVASLGSEWSFVGSGDFLGDGRSQVLIENANGAVALGEVGSAGQMSWTKIASLGSEWKFVGAGDYSGTGVDSFLIENAHGAVVTGTVTNGEAHYAQVGALGSEWSFHG